MVLAVVVVTAPDTKAGSGGVGVGNFDSCPESAVVLVVTEPAKPLVTANTDNIAIATAPMAAASVFLFIGTAFCQQQIVSGPNVRLRQHISISRKPQAVDQRHTGGSERQR